MIPAPLIKSNRVIREVSSPAWADNSAIVVDLPRGMNLNAVTVVVEGTIELTTGATAVRQDAPSQLLTRLDLFANGNQLFAQENGIMAAVCNAQRDFAQDLIVPGNGIAVHPVRATYRLDRLNIDGPRPKDSALHTKGAYMSLFQLRLQTAAPADLFDMTAGVIGAVALTITVYVDETEEFFTEDMYESRYVRRVSLQTLGVSAANSNLQVDLPVGGFFRAAKIRAYDGPAAYLDTPSDALINRVQLREGTNIRMDLAYDNLRTENANNIGMDEDGLPAGFVYADLCESPTRGSLSKLWDLRGVAQAYLELDVNAPANTGSIVIAIEEFYWQGARDPATGKEL